MSHFPENPGGSRTVLAGVIDPTVARLDFRARDGRLRAVPIALDRSFILVSAGSRSFDRTALVLTDLHGDSAVCELRDSGFPETLTTP